MSEPIRYTGKTEGSVLGSPHWEHPEGEWVKYEDYEKLKAQGRRMAMDSIHDLNQIGGLQEENARLRASSFVTAVPVEEYEKLKSEVERLEHQVRYWRIEAECDHGRWLRCLEDLEKLRGKSSV